MTQQQPLCAATDEAPRRDSPLVTAALILVACGCTAMLALYACLLVPFRIAGTLVPIAVVLAVVTTTVIPQILLRNRVPLWGAGLALLAWLAMVGFVSRTTPEGDVVLPGAGGASWVAYGVMFGGMLTGVASLSWQSLKPPPKP